MAAVFSGVFGIAMQVQAAPDSIEVSTPTNDGLQSDTEPQLIAQLWTELNTQELSLANSDRNSNSSSDLPAQLSVTQLKPTAAVSCSTLD